MRHTARTLYVGDREIPGSDDHEGFVAGRYRNGACSDIWTDVRRCAERTFTAYLPPCECGWLGSEHRATPSGYDAARAEWLRGHFVPVARDTAGEVVAGHIRVDDILTTAYAGQRSPRR